MVNYVEGVKIFIISDTEQDFEDTVQNWGIGSHKPVRLTNSTQLVGFSNKRAEIWDVRELTNQIESSGIEVFTMNKSGNFDALRWIDDKDG